MTELKLSQQLVMTPQLQMAIRLLSLPLHELLEELPDLVQKNPPLETRPREGALDASFVPRTRTPTTSRPGGTRPKRSRSRATRCGS
jgi:DNA-directed RNA polymerase specialized sigma54-like protein